MYAKLIVYDEEDDLYNGNGVTNRDGSGGLESVVPNNVYTFESKRMSYRKLRFKSTNEYYNMSEKIGTLTILSNLPLKEDSSDNKGFEVILLGVYDDEMIADFYLTACDSVLFLMNDNGKTIDKIACRNR